MKNSVWVAITVIALLAIGGWLLLRQSKNTSVIPQTTTAPAQSPSPEVSSPSSPSASVKEIKVSGSDFSFTPAAISLIKGDNVKLTFTNNGKFPHNFTITDMNLATKTVQPGQSDTIEFSVDKTGTFSYVCTVDAHEQKGMKGALTVQ